MMIFDETKIRKDTRAFLARKGQGYLKRLAEEAGLNTQSVRRVRDNVKVDLETLIAVNEALKRMGWTDQPSLDEEESGSTALPDGLTIEHILADELLVMVRKLKTGDLNPVEKGEDFRAFVAALHQSLDTKVKAIQKRGQKSD